MAKPIERELLEFFKTNTRDLPRTTQRWFELPNITQKAVANLNPDELRRRILAGEDINAILGMIQPRVTAEMQQFIDGFVPTVNRLMGRGKEHEAIQHATTSLELAA